MVRILGRARARHTTPGPTPASGRRLTDALPSPPLARALRIAVGKRRYSVKLWKTFTDCFNCLPVAAIVADKIFCCHGGLSPDLQEMKQIDEIDRPTDVPDTGLLCDLLWADPEKDVEAWGENDRGVSFTFGQNIVESFLAQHGFDLIARAHQVVEDGYEFFAERQLVTLFSAPNYCGELGATSQPLAYIAYIADIAEVWPRFVLVPPIGVCGH